jgi:hypothetical protein
MNLNVVLSHVQTLRFGIGSGQSVVIAALAPIVLLVRTGSPA